MNSLFHIKRQYKCRNLLYSAYRLCSTKIAQDVKDIEFAFDYHPSTDPNNESATLFLHGLYGYKEEWNFVVTRKEILDLTSCYTIDAVNHGDTSHFPRMTFEDQAQHVIRFADLNNINKFSVVGHSMGGRAAMKTAMLYPDRVQSVMSIDAPACGFDAFPGYADRTISIVRLLGKLKVEGIPHKLIEDMLLRLYKNDKISVNRLMKNFRLLSPDSDFIEFKSNPEYIKDNILQMCEFNKNGKYYGPATMLVGGISNRFKLEHYKDCFPNLKESDVISVPNTGHWIHIDNWKATTDHLVELLKKRSN